MARPHNFMDNYGRPDFKLPYRWNDDTPLSLPLGPKSVFATSPYMIGVIDIRWDNPSIYAENNGLQVLGVNIYRAYDSPEATYTQLNTSPVGALYYRDQTKEVLVSSEDPVAGGRFIAGTNATGDWIIHTYNKPIIIPSTNGEIAQHPKHVVVRVKPTAIDSFQTVPAWRVVGETGEVYLINRKVYNHATNRCDDPILPILSQGGAVTVSYTYINGWIQTDINRKIYYKATTVALDPETNKIIETPMNQVEAVSLYDMERIDWIWAEAIRRNRWILEQAGERVKVFIRKWAGERCPCWDEQYKQAKNDDPLCFPAGTNVSMENGAIKTIENVTVGDSVLTVDGIKSSVLKTMQRQYHGDLISINTIGKLPFSCTPEHPILVIPKEECFCVRYKKTYNVNKCVPMGKRKCREGKTICEKTMTPVWKEAKELKVGDYVLVPTIPEGSVSVGQDKSFLMGVYLAEGSVSMNGWGTKKNRIRFALSSSERFFADKIKDTFYRVYGSKLHETISSKGTGLELYGYSCEAALELLSNCGSDSHNKKISSVIMSAKKDDLRNLLVGYIMGDGCINSRKGYKTSTVSKDLAYQIQLIYAKLGMPSVLNKFYHTEKREGWGNGHWYYINEVPSCEAEKLKLLYNKEVSHNVKKKQHKVLNFGQYIGYPIESIRSQEYSGIVYNMEVDRNNTYLVENCIVHNCYGTGIIGGFEGPYELLIAPPETEKTVQLMDMGLHVNYDWNTFCGPYPLLNDRDFIVRQNNDRYSIAHVNPQGARGAIFQQHFMLAPLDQHDIRYKVPINGGLTVLPSWNAYRTDRPTDASPTIPDKPEVPEQYQLHGRTVTFESIVS